MHPQFLEDVMYWFSRDRKVAVRVLRLVEAVQRDPLTGIGKPEPLRHFQGNVWSRRITQEHRLVYTVAGEKIVLLQARYDY